MSVTVYFANVSKKRNSTYQGTFNVSYDCTFKAPTSLDRPTFLVSAATMDYNAAKYGDRYYLIDDVVSVRQGQWEVSCILDVLATYKADILASTQYVCYSSEKNSIWLPDTRVPILKSVSYDEKAFIPGVLIDTGGFYCLTVNGKNGCECYALTKAQLKQLIFNINNWAISDYDKITAGTFDPQNPQTYDFSSVENSIKALSYMMVQSGAIGNSYQNAPQMIRSCIWLPLVSTNFTTGSVRIFLGDYDTGIDAPMVNSEPYAVDYDITIPWHYNDWRRSICETVYLSLPYAGVIQLTSDSLSSLSSIHVRMSICALDGNIAYSVADPSDKLIGYYGGNCSAPYAIGINQKAGVAEITQTLIAGAEKTVAVAIDSSISPVSMAGSIAGATLEGVNTVYQTANTAMSTHPSCVGSMGGSAGSALAQVISVITVSHPTAIDPDLMVNTMGYPTMKPMSLSGLTGFCQCANAHVAVAAQAREIDAIDTYLNTGFFIE